MINEEKREILKKLVCNSDGVGGKGYKSSAALRKTSYYKRIKALKKLSKGPDNQYSRKLKDADSFRRTRKIVGI